MTKLKSFIFIIALLGFFNNCGNEASKEKDSSKKDRDMFGLYIKRGLTNTSDSLIPGYIMFPVPNSASTYLINRNGEVVHEWKGNYESFHPYLLEDGSIMQGAMDPDYPTFGFGGPYGRIQKINWDSKMLWDFEYASKNTMVHHDFSIMPNGNILAIAYETYSYDDAISNGRKPELIPGSGPWLEKIIEIEPEGTSEGKIVWEWHVADHLIQDYDESKKNFGDPSKHPELLDFNLGDSIPPAITQDSLDILKSKGKGGRNLTTNNKGADIFHFNAIKYNEELDQIVFSSPAMSEIYIIDHGLSTKEAAGHSGGKRGKGGDFLYRWGNPENYRKGDSLDRKLYFQHDVRYIEKGKPGEGNLTIFNNDIPVGRDSLNYSAIYEIKPPLKEDGNFQLLPNGRFGPDKQHWNYVAKDSVSFYGSFISGAHRMENGNTFINEGPKGRLFEVSPAGEILWEYHIPYRGEIRKPDGEPNNFMNMTFSAFRATFIPANHPGLKNRDLKPIEPQPTTFKVPPKPKKEEEKS
jgi:hypothetical protein